MMFSRNLALGAAAAISLAAAAKADTVEFMTWSYAEEANRPAIEAMMESFEGGTVVPLGYAWGEMTRNTFLRARTNTLPDISQVQARLLPTVANIDQIVDLSEVFERDVLDAMFDPAWMAFGDVGGRQVALPWIGGTIGMAANSRVLDAAGIDEIPTTIEAFRSALVQIRDTVPNSVPYGMATMNNNSIVLDYMIWVWAFGGDLMVDGAPAVNTPEATAALAFMTELVAERLAAPEIDRPDARRLMAQEMTGFMFDAPVVKSHVAQFAGDPAYEQNIVPMATPVLNEGDDPTSIQWGHVLVMYKQDNASADSAASKFLMHLLDDDVLVPHAKAAGFLPATRSGQAHPDIVSDPYLTAWAANAIAPRRNTIAALSNGAEVANVIGEEVQSAILGQKSAEQAANDMQSRLSAIITD